MSVFDDRDKNILGGRLAAWDQKRGPRVGDFCIMPDGEMKRFTHDWGERMQTGGISNGSFYLGVGFMSYSGSLDPTLSKADLEPTGEMKDGAAWFFHHNDAFEDNGVTFSVPCRVYRYAPKNRGVQ